MKEAFVYLWHNKTNDCKYIGYHKGTQDDGYICSSSNERFWKDFKNSDHAWERYILFEGTSNECLQFEQSKLKSIDISSDEWYNNARGAEIIFTQEVKNKIRNHHLGGTSGMLGKKHSQKTKDKMAIKLKNRIFTDDHLIRLRKPNKNKGKKGSDEFRNAMRDRFSDSNIYSFFNIHTKETFNGTRKEFSNKFNIARHNIASLVNKQTKILGNTWILQ